MINKERLLNVARALREYPEDESRFDMGGYGTDCGTPMCALGHYAHRTDLQDEFILDRGVLRDSDGADVCVYSPGDGYIANHFGVNGDQLKDLFGAYGCGDAETAADAAAYIERFVASEGRS